MDYLAHPHGAMLIEPVLFTAAILVIIAFALFHKGNRPRRAIVTTLGFALLIVQDTWFALARAPLTNSAYAATVMVLLLCVLALLLIGKNVPRESTPPQTASPEEAGTT